MHVSCTIEWKYFAHRRMTNERSNKKKKQFIYSINVIGLLYADIKFFWIFAKMLSESELSENV